MSRAALVAFAIWLAGVTAFAAAPPVIRFQWDTNRPAVRVEVPAAALKTIASGQIARVITVAVEPPDVLNAIGLPPVAGKYSVVGNVLQFEPAFPFEPGMAYRATLKLPGRAAETSLLRLARPVPGRTTVVSHVYPSAEILPQNLLKFYIHFSAPMSGGHIYQHIRLAEQGGAPVELPFLEIDEELWDPGMTRLTLFLDPGRIKREVKPLEEVGPALEPGKKYLLTIDPGWLDARGAALKEPFEKRFAVAEPDRTPPDPSAWKIKTPKSGSTGAVELAFADPMDQALALRMIGVTDPVGRPVGGEKSLGPHERTWRFQPAAPWKPGRYQLLIQTRIEDLAGNNIGKAFEVDLIDDEPLHTPPRTVTLALEID